jgi:hypothetical protein
MARARTQPTPEAPVSAPPDRDGRAAFSVEAATGTGLFGVEVDQTPDLEYASPGAGGGPNTTPLTTDQQEADS